MTSSELTGFTIINIFSSDHSLDRYSGNNEPLSAGLRLGDLAGLSRIGIHSEVLAPGRRTSFPHAESANEEFVLVLAGMPTLWVDGYTRVLGVGDAVGFPPGTGLCHSILNESTEEARLLVVGERRSDNRTFYCADSPVQDASLGWLSPPERVRGPHVGRPRSPRTRQK